MRRIAILALAIFSLTLTSRLLARDGKPEIDFDQGIDITRILQDVRGTSELQKLLPSEKVSELPPKLLRIKLSLGLLDKAPGVLEDIRPCLSYPPEEDTGSAILHKHDEKDGASNACTKIFTKQTLSHSKPVAAMGRESPVFGSFRFPPFRLIPTGPIYLKAQTFPPLLQTLPPPVRDPLLKKYEKIEITHAELVSEGEDLDVEDDQLDADAKIIINWGRRIDARRDLLRQAREELYRECVGRPLPPDELKRCKAWERRLNSCIERDNNSVRRFNAAVETWRETRTQIQDKGTVFKKKVKVWVDGTILLFIAGSEEALEEDRNKTRVTVQAQGDNPPVEKSASVIMEGVLCKEEGVQMLGELWEKLTASERRERDEALEKAEVWIMNRSPEGVTAPIEKTFQNRNRRDPSARIDVVVHKGTAFVTCPCCSK